MKKEINQEHKLAATLSGKGLEYDHRFKIKKDGKR